jgi:formylglycine-generating enzyme required for sulfatase activity
MTSPIQSGFEQQTVSAPHASVFAARTIRRPESPTPLPEPSQAEEAVEPWPKPPEPATPHRGRLIGIGFGLLILGTAFVLWQIHGRSGALHTASIVQGPAADARQTALNARSSVDKLLALAPEFQVAAFARDDLAEATLTASGAQGQFDAGNIAGALATWQEAGKIAGQAVLKAARQRHETLLRSAHLPDIPGFQSTAAARLSAKVASAEQSARTGDHLQAAVLYREAGGIVADVVRDTTRQLEQLAASAAEHHETSMALYFYGYLIRLDPDHPAARAFLYRNRFKPGETTSNAAGLTFAYIPPGHYRQGSPESEVGHHHDETLHEVALTRGFFLGVTEVTQSQWDAVMGAGDAAKRLKLLHEKPAFIGADLPMHSIRWDEAMAFCRALSARDSRSYRLPTEAEWEYACRAGTVSAFNTGSEGLSGAEADIDDGTMSARLAPAPAGATGRANAWGLRDMHGNVWEWCADWSAPYPSGSVSDPTGPSDSQMTQSELALKTVRGGGWNAPGGSARSANRWENSPAVATDYIGFRVLLGADLTAP